MVGHQVLGLLYVELHLEPLALALELDMELLVVVELEPVGPELEEAVPAAELTVMVVLVMKARTTIPIENQ